MSRLNTTIRMMQQSRFRGSAQDCASLRQTYNGKDGFVDKLCSKRFCKYCQIRTLERLLTFLNQLDKL